MGSIIEEKVKKLPFRIFVASEIPVKTITVVKNGIDWKNFEFNERVVNLEFKEELDKGYYYVRVERMDGEYVWSSPIFL